MSEVKRPKPAFEPTDYGFKWGSLEITRLMSEDGWVVVEARTPKKAVQIYATKTGKMTITEDTHE
jgi:hypothetical protein